MEARVWTEEKLQLLAEIAQEGSTKDAADVFGVHPRWIRRLAARAGIEFAHGNFRPWTLDEEVELRQLVADKVRVDIIRRVIGRTPQGIRDKIRRLGLTSTARVSRWTPELLAELRALVELKWSSGAIAKKFGFTRNAVIGRARRLGLTFNGGAGGGNCHAPRPPREPKPKKPNLKRLFGLSPAMVPVETLTIPNYESPDAVAFLDVKPHQCRWPLNDPGPDFQMCGSEKLPDRSYCYRHCLLAYRKPERGPKHYVGGWQR